MKKVSADGSGCLGVGTPTTAGLVAVVGALVLGILGMHGFSQHGVARHGSQPVAAVAADPHTAHPAPDHRPGAADGHVATTSAGSSGNPVDHGAASDMVMLCGAMLLAAAAGLLPGRRHLRALVHAPLSLVAPPHLPSFPATARGGTGPPDAWEFSVVRC